ncbi:Acyl dehydratase [Rhizobium sp. RU20A]|uniref:MaoC family dehydratase n=1 Tax=Rhizobium sp. RU20A TaxID=1907412 RepID=UPI000956D303|nr:MaoC family dehydratase [Rhizobium sp. RU20A]SIQ26774.1 Acyl dehydratase [Rhizobium sp. RU20A]
MSATLMFEDFTPGRRFDYAPHAVTADQIVAFAMEFDPQPMHLDEEAGRRSILGGLSASGWHTCAMVMRMMCDSFVGRSSSQGSPGIDTMQWRRPVLAGDTLSGYSHVLEARLLRSRPGIGIVRFRNTVLNQHGETVAISEGPILFRSQAKPQVHE